MNATTTMPTRIGGGCPLCGRMSYVDLTPQEDAGLQAYVTGGGYIQEVLPQTDAAVREFVMGVVRNRQGYCRDCMDLMFGHTSERINYIRGGKHNE